MLEFKIKEWFFDTEKVMAAVDKAERQNLSKFGAFVRRRARSLIRKAGKKKGRQSEPGQPPRWHSPEPNLRTILFAYEPQNKSVVIGPVLLNQSTAIDGRVPEALEKGGRLTVRQRSKRGKAIRRVITIQKRPFMAPALKHEAAAFPDIWRDSVRGSDGG